MPEISRMKMAEEIIDKTIALREAQRTYFRTHNYGDLTICKRAEKELDTLLVVWTTGAPRVEQETLL